MNVEAFAKAVDDVREAWVEKITGVSHEALTEQAVIVADAVRKDGTGVVVRNVMDSQTIIQELYSDIYLQVFPEVAEILYNTYSRRSVKQIVDLIENWLQAARALLLSRPIQRRVKLVQQETIDEINKRVLIGLEQGLSVDRIADLIDGTEYGRPVEDRFSLVDPYTGPPVFDSTVRQRSQGIARTEVMAASNSGSRQGILDTGLETTHFWIPILDDRLRDSHRAQQLREPRPMDEPFAVGPEPVYLMFPSDPNGQGSERGVAAETILCRCVEGYEVV